MKIPNLKSSTALQGEVVTQIITFKGGTKKTFHNVLSSTIVQGQFTKFFTEDGTMVMINDKNVLYVEIFKTEK